MGQSPGAIKTSRFAGRAPRLERTADPRSLRPHGTSVAVLVASLAVFGTLSWLSYTANQHSDQHLLQLQTKEAGSVLAAALPDIETPLASAAELAEATNGNAKRFESFISHDVGKGALFGSAGLWSLRGTRPRLVVLSGSAPKRMSPAQAAAVFARAESESTISLTRSGSNLGYAFVSPGARHDYAVYAQSPLPRDRLARVQRSSAFSDLSYALYLGRSTRPSALLEASTLSLPLNGTTSTTVVPFGDAELTFVATSTHSLSGALSADSWWLIALLGTVLALGAALTSERLARGRQSAERFAKEVERLYSQQRDVAVTLQHALLPEDLPEMTGVEMRTRYVAGVEGLEIGGDWYDALQLDESRLLFVVGDVSGRGLRAATIMASLRYAIRAYALQGDLPSAIFAKLTHVVDIRRDRHFATVLCVLVDTNKNEVTFASAGHPPLLLRGDDGTEFLSTPVGPPVGIPGSHVYESTTVSVGAGSTLLAFTDGLIERRDESLDEGLSRLRAFVAKSDPDESLDGLLGDVVATLVPEGPSDDIALLGVRWHR